MCRRRRRNQRRHDLTAAAALQRRLIAVPAAAAVVIAVVPPAIPLVLLPRRRLGLAVLNRRLGGRVDPRGGADGARARRAVAPGEGRPRRRRGVVGRCGGSAVGGVGGWVAGDRRRRGFTGHGEREIERVYVS